jgi:hypothetical protein
VGGVGFGEHVAARQIEACLLGFPSIPQQLGETVNGAGRGLPQIDRRGSSQKVDGLVERLAKGRREDPDRCGGRASTDASTIYEDDLDTGSREVVRGRGSGDTTTHDDHVGPLRQVVQLPCSGSR